MSRILTIAWQDLRVFLSARSNLPSLLLTPTVMTIIIGLVSGGAIGGPGVRRLDVIDLDQSPASIHFLALVRQANPELTLCPMDDDGAGRCDLPDGGALTVAQSLDRVTDETSLAVLVVPQGFGQAVADLQPISLTFRAAQQFGAAQAAQEAVDAAVSQLNSSAAAAVVGGSVADRLAAAAQPGEFDPGAMSTAIYQRALVAWESEPIDVAFTLSGQDAPAGAIAGLQLGLGQSVPGMGTMFVMMTVFGAMAALIVEKQDGTLQRLATMPVSKTALLAGKVLGRFSLGLVQFAVVFIVGALLGMDFGQDPLALALLAVSYTLSVTALSFAVGSRLTNPAQASGLSLLLTLTLAPLGGAWWPLAISPRFMQVAGHVSPIAWAMEAFTKLTYEQGTLADVWVQLIVLAGFALVGFLIAIPRFRYTLE
jgi:ABC-2 type transport system permease protein